MIALYLFSFAALASNEENSELSVPNAADEQLDERNFDRDVVVNSLLPENDASNFHPNSDDNQSEDSDSEKMDVHRRIIPDDGEKSDRQIEFDRDFSGEGIPIVHEKLELNEENIEKIKDANPPEVIQKLRDELRVQKEKTRLREKHARENEAEKLEEKKVSLKSELEKAVNDFHNSREFEELQQNVNEAPEEPSVETEKDKDVKLQETSDDSQKITTWACLAAISFVALLIFGAVKCARKLKNQGDVTEEEFFIGESYDIWSPRFKSRKRSDHIE